jgi:phosphate transport system substrate-binding protein
MHRWTRRVDTPAAVLVAALAALALGVAAESGPAPPTSPRAVSGGAPRARGAALDVAGSGSNVPLTRALAAAWCAGRAGCRVVVHESIGSTGAVRALRDDAIDIGLISRPLTERELRGVALRVTPYARTPVVLAAHPGTSQRSLRRADLVALVRGARTTWDDGTPAVFLLRERGDSSQLALAQAVPGLAAAEEDAQRARRFRVLFSDADLRYAVAGTQGALGVSDLGGLALDGPSLVPIALDGVAPTDENVALGRYTITKDLSFVTRPDVRPDARAFVAFATSPGGAAVIRASHCLPLGSP